jgi:hypothetical protein
MNLLHTEQIVDFTVLYVLRLDKVVEHFQFHMQPLYKCQKIIDDMYQSNLPLNDT